MTTAKNTPQDPKAGPMLPQEPEPGFPNALYPSQPIDVRPLPKATKHTSKPPVIGPKEPEPFRG